MELDCSNNTQGEQKSHNQTQIPARLLNIYVDMCERIQRLVFLIRVCAQTNKENRWKLVVIVILQKYSAHAALFV